MSGDIALFSVAKSTSFGQLSLIPDRFGSPGRHAQHLRGRSDPMAEGARQGSGHSNDHTGRDREGAWTQQRIAVTRLHTGEGRLQSGCPQGNDGPGSLCRHTTGQRRAAHADQSQQPMNGANTDDARRVTQTPWPGVQLSHLWCHCKIGHRPSTGDDCSRAPVGVDLHESHESHQILC